MKFHLIPGFFLLFFFGASAQITDQQEFRFIETTVTVDTLLVPDIINVSFQIEERQLRSDVGYEDLDYQITRKLKSIGIDIESQLFVSAFESNVIKKSLSNKISRTKTYELIVSSASKIGEVVVALEDLGDFNYNIVGTTHSDLDDIELSLKGKASRRGKLQAAQMLSGTGSSVGAIMYVSDVSGIGNSQYNGSTRFRQESLGKLSVERITIAPIILESKLLMKFAIL